MFSRIRRRLLRDDRGVMSYTMLLSMMIPSMLGLIAAVVLMSMHVNALKHDKQVSRSAAGQLAALMLSDLNDGYPADYLTMSKANLRKATTFNDPTTDAKAYVTEFEAGDEGWTYVKVAAFPNSRASMGQSVFTYKYHASDNIGYLGTASNGSGKSTGRPVWASGSGAAGGAPTLGLYEMIDQGSDKTTAPAAPWETGARPTEPLNMRVIRTVEYGVILAWDRPSNSGASNLNGYELGQVTQPIGAGCNLLYPDDRDYDGVSAFMVLNSNIDAAPRAWKCNTVANTQVYVQGTSPNGLGAKAVGTLDKLPITSDEFPKPPTGVPTNLKVDETSRTTADVSWTGVTCLARSTPQYRFVWVSGATGASDWLTEPKYTADITGATTTLEWKVEAKCAGKYNDSTTVESEVMTFVPPSAPPENVRVLTTAASSTTIGWNEVQCVTGSTPSYRLSLQTLTGVNKGNTGWVAALSQSIPHSAGDGYTVRVQVRCTTDDGLVSPPANSDPLSFVAPPAVPTGLAVVGTPGATQTTVTWNTATCSSGSSPEYQFAFAPADGKDYPIQTSNRITVTNPTGADTASWTVQARCTYGYTSSPWSKSKQSSYPLTIAAPTAATGLKIISLAKGTAGWNASTCTTTGSSPEYKFQWVSPSTGSSSTITATQYSHTTRTEGVNLTWRVVSTCVSGDRTSKSVTSATGPAFNYATSDPTGSFTVKTNGVSTVSVNTSSIKCGPGSYPIYRTIMTRHGNDTADRAQGNWVKTMSMNTANYEGWYTQAQGQIACKATGDNGLSGGTERSSNTASWTRTQSTAFNLSGGLASIRNAAWDGQCNAGNTYRTYYWQVYAGGRELASQTGWTNQKNYSNQGVAWGSGYVRQQAGCESNYNGAHSALGSIYKSPTWQ